LPGATQAQSNLIAALCGLERNDRGLGLDSNRGSPNKKVFRIDLAGATDASDFRDFCRTGF
jgi:hypothetical protein